MGNEKNELVDKIQEKSGRELTAQEREILQTENYLGASELNFPVAAQTLLGIWKGSFAKIARWYRPGIPVSSYASEALLRQYKKSSRNFVALCIAMGILIVWGISGIFFLFGGSITTRLSDLIMVILFSGVVAFNVWDTRRLQILFMQNDRLKTIIMDIVDNSTTLEEIYPRTPRPWREIFLGSPPKDFEGMAKLVAWNLDWYLERPSVHFRWSWVAGITIPTIWAVLFLFNKPSSGLVVSSLAGFYSGMILLSLESWRKLTGLALLIEETKRIFSETEKV